MFQKDINEFNPRTQTSIPATSLQQTTSHLDVMRRKIFDANIQNLEIKIINNKKIIKPTQK